jgi:hypothetical protein
MSWLHDMRESPDADLLHAKGFHVGVEVVRAADRRVPEANQRIVAATEAIRSELSARSMAGRLDIRSGRDSVDGVGAAARDWRRAPESAAHRSPTRRT